MKRTTQSFLLLLVLSVNAAFAQQKLSKEQKEKLSDADIYFEITDYQKALRIYERLLKVSPEDAEMNYKAGVCHYYLDDNKKEALGLLKKSRELGNYNSLYFIGQYYHLQEQFDLATDAFEEYRAFEGDKDFDDKQVGLQLQYIDQAKLLMSTPVNVNIYNIGDSVNTMYPDYGPLIPADESFMIFTSRREGSTGNKVGPYKKYYEDIYIAKNVNGKFEQTKNIGIPVNTTTHDAAVGLSADGKTLIIYKTNRQQTGGDLYMSEQENSVWSKPKKLSEMINSEYQEPSATLSPDGNVMYFSSTRPGGYGGRDIYRAIRLGNGNWSLPMNLGSNINTEYDEDGPFIHPDGHTLYFSSKGHKSMGGYDIFKTELKNNYWSIPTNLGYPINSVDNDVYFVLAANGKRGYYSSFNEVDSANHDIYVVSFETELQQLKIIKGKVMSATTNTPLVAKIKLIDEDDNVEGEFNSNEQNGNYLLLVKPDQNYKLTIEADGYEMYSENLLFDGGRLIKEIAKEISLRPVK
jgi:hypothetical protein